MAAMLRKSKTVLFFFGVLILVLGLAAGCGSACEDLANQICKCQPTRTKEARCKSYISAAAQNFDLTDAEEAQCQDILDEHSCTCEALAAGSFSLCGLAADPMSAVE